MAAILLFDTPSATTTNSISEKLAGELSKEDLKQLIARLKERKVSHFMFSLPTAAAPAVRSAVKT